MRPGCAKADSVISSSCSGICQYTCNKSAQSPCGCLSLDNSQELPVYIIKLARALQRVVQQNDADCHTAPNKQSCFHCGQAPPISIRAYIHRIAKHSKCSPVCFMMAWSYLKRLSQDFSELAVTSYTVHRLVITAVMLAAKLMDDKYYNNAFYAKIGGITTSDLNQMELEMLRMLEYRTLVTGPQIKELLMRLEAFQAPGHITSVLCRKRSSHAPECAAPQLPVGVHKSKVAKGFIVTQRSRQLPLPFSSSSVVNQTISDVSCKVAAQAVPAASKASSVSLPSEDFGVVPAKSVQRLTTRHSTECLVLPTSASLIEVSA